MPRLQCSAILPLAVLLVVPSVTGWQLSAQGQSARVSVYGPRPLNDAVLELQRRHRWVITYEDAYYDYQGDLVDVTTRVHRVFDPKKPRIWSAPQRALVFDYQLSDTAKPETVLRNLIDLYHVVLHDYEYSLLVQGTAFHIVPAASKNTQGELTPRRSRFDARVTIPEAQRSVAETISLVVDGVNRTSKTQIQVVSGPAVLFSRTTIRAGAQNERARDVLMRALEATGRRLSWGLLCSGGSDKSCGLNFRVVD